jgi:amino acid adenylation domain-containing protein
LLIEIEPAKNNEILLRATYKDELFPATQVSVLLQQMDRLISGMIANHNRSLKALVMDLGVESVLSISNPYPDLSGISKTRTLATVFEDTAAKYPDAIALEFAPDIQQGVAVQTEKRTYAELNAAANRLARELVHLRGTVPDQLVAVCMEKSVLCYTSILATVKAGAGYLPLTPETPVERIKQILRNASVKVLLSTQDVIERIGPIDGLDMLDVYKLDFSAHSPRNLGIKSHSKALAYAVFTSGSTGVPKGVLVEHEQTVANLDQLAEMYPTAVGKRALQFCNIAFDVSVFDIFFTWHRGMVLCSATKDVCLRDMEATINALGVTHLSMTPTVAALVNPNNVPTVEFLVTAGEAVTEKVFNDWAGRGLWQGYGPSETTNISNVKPRVEKGDDIGNFGPIFSNSSAFVVAPDEEELVLLPRGGVGELVIGGAQVVRGYLNLEELTARKFVVHADYGRVYRSGDIVRLLPNDDIVFVKRVDDQVKIRGNRIELGEINSVLLRNAELVLDAVTLVVSKDGSPHLVSFVASKSHHGSEFKVVEAPEVRATVKTLFKHLTEFVPAYMVPNAIVPVTEIPMTTQAKTDKRRLVTAYLSLSDELLDGFSEGAISEEVSGEWNELERQVARIVAEVAQVEVGTIARTTSIFKLGLDSISAIGLSNKLKSVGLSKLDVSQIMKNSTIAALARVLGQQGGAATGDSMKGLQALKEFADDVRDSVLEQLRLPEDQVVKILPCTPLQESTLSTKKGVDPRTFYNHTVLNLTADAQRLKSAWQTTVHSLEILRTCFAVTSHYQHAFAQVVIKEHALPWSEQKLESDENLIEAIEEHITAVSAALDIAKPPYSFGLFTTPGKSALVMSFHHSLYDGFAMDLMLQDVQRAYVGAEIPGRASFDSYLQYMESVDLAAADGFWKERLNGLELTAFPDLTGKSNSFRKNLVGMASRRISSSRTLSAINEGCRAVDSSLLALGQSAWARLLSAYTGESDVCFGNVVSGRTIAVDGVETIVAPCFNTVPIRVQVLQDGTARSVMETLQTLNADIIPFQLTPLRRIMAALKTEGRALFDTLFILQHTSENSFKDLWEELEDRGEMDVSGLRSFPPFRCVASADS